MASASYNKIKFNCLAEGEEAWELQKQEWKDAVFSAHESDGPLPPDAENAEIMLYMQHVLDQHEELVSVTGGTKLLSGSSNRNHSR